MRIPVWLTLGIALLAFVWGAYRIRLALRSDAADERARGEGKRGLFALARRTHFLFGVVYLILGGLLVATTFGWNPIGGLLGPRTEVPDRTAAPSKPGSVPIDHTGEAPRPAGKAVGGPTPRDTASPIDQLPQSQPARPSAPSK